MARLAFVSGRRASSTALDDCPHAGGRCCNSPLRRDGSLRPISLWPESNLSERRNRLRGSTTSPFQGKETTRISSAVHAGRYASRIVAGSKDLGFPARSCTVKSRQEN